MAQLFVEVNRGMVRRLVLASTTAYADVDQYLAEWPEYERRSRMKVARPVWAESRPAEDGGYARDTVQWALTAATTAIWDLDRLEEYLRLLEGVSFSGEWLRPFREGRLHAWRPADPEQVLRDFPGPILILHGAHDMGFPVQVAQRLHEAVPAASLRIIDRAGHMAHFEQPEAWASAVLDFLGS